MVSFQCNSCGDVLTKPKLDKHRATCRSSFDCIDCGKRFETPADYKGHTSCISEAEKYHKTLYNGGGGPGRNGRNQQPRQQGGGQRGNHRSQWQQRNVNQATGANDTPLGTPVRMSPVNDTPVVKENTQEGRPIAATPKKRKTAPETIESKDTSEPVKKKKKKQGVPETTKTVEVKPGTKRKSTSEVTVAKRPPQDPSLQIAEEQNSVNEVGGKKKKKKESKAKEDEKGEAKKKEKEKRKKKEDLSSSGQEPNPGAMVDDKVIVAVQGAGVFSVIDGTQSTKRKSKLEAAATDRSADVPAPVKPPQPAALEVAQDDQGDRKKKRQSGNHHGGDGDGKQVAQGNGSNLKEKRKEKKKKRKSEGQTASVVG